MHIHFVVEGRWIKYQISQWFVSECNKAAADKHIFTMGHQKIENADVYVYNCFNHFMIHEKSENAKDICYVTHFHKHSFEEHIRDGGVSKEKLMQADGWIHMCKRYYNYMAKQGFPKEKMAVIPWGIDMELFNPRIRIGIFQNGEVEGKGLYFLRQFCELFKDIEYFEFLFVGKGWEPVLEVLNRKGIKYENILDATYLTDFPGLMKSVDYVLIPSLWEGGPMAYLDALACGKPVIAANVGFIPDIGGYYSIFEPGHMQQFLGIMYGLVGPVRNRLEHVKRCSWKKIAPLFIETIEKLVS